MRVILCTTLFAALTASAFAQQPPQPAPNAPAAQRAPAPQAAPAKATGWRASKLVGVDVYNQQNEKLGEINELIIDRSGRVAGVIIGVGGFLGMGERDVMVTMDRLQFRDDDQTTTSGSRENRTTTGADRDWYPDRAVLNANKDQLKAMPEFKY
jgi:sporulation protein YlmC with PRC-barrel domain